MKIAAFEVRDDEQQYFAIAKAAWDIELACYTEGLTMQNIASVAGCTGVTILGQYQYRQEILDALKAHGVTCLATRTIGYNHIDINYAKSIGLHVCNTQYGPNGVADYTVMMILLCLRHYKSSLWRTNVNDFSLMGLQGRELKDLTVGIIGTGRIGCCVLKNLSSFGCKLLACDPHENPAAKQLAHYVDLETIYRSCDIISLHMPLTDATYHMINKETIAKMKPNVVLINCARGSLMKIEDLIDGIENKRIGALGLDCIEHEEGIIHQDFKVDIISNREMAYLRQFPNVIHTQHMAFYTDAAIKTMVLGSVESLCQMAQGIKVATQLC